MTTIRILLVDDDAQARLQTFNGLSKNDQFTITEVASHSELDQILETESFQQAFDIAICDISLHGSPLFETLDLLRSKNFFLPVVILSSNHSVEIAIKGIQAGADDYILRSSRNIERLPHTILNALEQRSQRRVLVEGKQADVQLQAYADEIVRKNQALAEARDKALEALRLKSEYLAMMGHEIRTPMNAMTGMTELLMGTSLTHEQREYIDIMRDSSQVLLALINDILDFSKIEAGKMALEVIEFNPLEVIESTSEAFASNASLKNLDLVIYVSPQIPPKVKGDPVRLRQVLTNLISNAIKFTSAGEVEIRADLLEETDKFVMLLFQVRDTGIGLSEESLAQLFQPFTQAEDSTSRKYGGSGLGLAISRRLVELMDGEISVDSALGLGSTFWFTATFERDDQTTYPKQAGSDLGTVGIKTLIIDQNPSSREVIKCYLEMLEMQTREATSLAEGIRLLTSGSLTNDPPQILVVGLSSLDKENQNLLTEVAQLPKIGPVYSILLTPINQRRLGQDALKMGFSVHLNKPLKRNKFIEVIRLMLSGKTIQVKDEEPVTLETNGHHEDQLKGLLQVTPGPDNLVLLAEDNLTNQRLTSLQLQKLGYAIEIASNGSEAVKAINQNSGRYLMALMDLHMPDMGGMEATKQIREAEVLTHKHLPIIALTASAMVEDKDICLKAGMDDFITKPVMLGDLHRILQKWGRAKNHLHTGMLEPRPTPPSLPVLDTHTLQEIRMLQIPGEPDVLTEMITIFLHDSQGYINNIMLAISASDPVLLKRSSHSLKGSSGNIGGRALAARCAEMESLAAEIDLNHARALLPQIDFDYHKLCEALAQERNPQE